MKRAALALVVFCAGPARAAVDAVSFNARSTAMGDALTADSQDLSGLSLNPAAVGQLRRGVVQANIRRIYQVPGGRTDLSGSALGAGVPLPDSYGGGALGLSWIYDEFSPIGLDRTLGFTYASRSWREIGPGILDVGTTFKLLSRSARAGGGFSKIGIDLGAYYAWGERSMGLSLLNVNSPDMSVGAFRDRAPAEFRLGFSQRVHRFTVDMDFSKREPSFARKANESLGLGVEHAWGTTSYGTFAGRTGLSIGSVTRSWSLGAGWSLFGTKVDYAVRIPVSGGGERWGHVVSLSYKFGQWDPEAEYERLLSSEIRYREDLSRALEASEVKQWKLAEDLRLMREEIEDVRRALDLKEVESGRVSERLQRAQEKLKVKELEERRRQAQDRLEDLRKERERLRLLDVRGRFQDAWNGYEKLKREGVADAVLIDRLKNILREYQDKGIDLDEAHRELQRLMKSAR